MRTFTIEQIKVHFKGVPYSYSSTFISLLIKNNILVRISINAYAYDLDKLSRDIITLIIDECRNSQNKYSRKYHVNRNNTRK